MQAVQTSCLDAWLPPFLLHPSKATPPHPLAPQIESNAQRIEERPASRWNESGGAGEQGVWQGLRQLKEAMQTSCPDVLLPPSPLTPTPRSPPTHPQTLLVASSAHRLSRCLASPSPCKLPPSPPPPHPVSPHTPHPPNTPQAPNTPPPNTHRPHSSNTPHPSPPQHPSPPNTPPKHNPPTQPPPPPRNPPNIIPLQPVRPPTPLHPPQHTRPPQPP